MEIGVKPLSKLIMFGAADVNVGDGEAVGLSAAVSDPEARSSSISVFLRKSEAPDSSEECSGQINSL